jgi:uncharacterized protein YutD
MRIAGLKILKKKKTPKKDKITRILAKVTEICDYACEHNCTEQAHFEELEWMLNRYVK